MTRGGTGKTYASAFAIREILRKREKETGRNVRALFVVHREQIAKQAVKVFQIVRFVARKKFAFRVAKK